MDKGCLAAWLSCPLFEDSASPTLLQLIGGSRVAPLEKTMHSIRAESAEAKIAAESKLAEAYKNLENAQKKTDEANSKVREAESLRAEASRYERTAAIKLREVEAREDELRRRLILFNSQCEVKEKDISHERHSLYESQKILQQEQEKMLERQTCLDQREEHIFGRLEELRQLEKQLETAKVNLEAERTCLKEEKSNFSLDVRALVTREESIIEREALLDRKERELLVFQEKLATKEHNEIERVQAEHQCALEQRKSEFEAELQQLRKVVDDELEMKRLTFEGREIDLQQRIKVNEEKENSLQLQSMALAERNEDLMQKLKLLEEKEQSLAVAEKEAERKVSDMQKQKEEIEIMQLDIMKVKKSLEAEKNETLQLKEKVEITAVERNDLLDMEKRLKEEIDNFRAQQAELAAEAEKLREEKEKFEREWEFIDEKRVELQREADSIAEERKSISQYLKNEQESLKMEKDSLRNQFKADVQALTHEREEFIREMECEHSNWLSKIQKEGEDIMEDMELQKIELENSIRKRQDEIEAYLKEREAAFEREKDRELQHVSSQKEKIAIDLEHVASEIKKIDDEKIEIALDRVQREKEWSEIKSSIDELNMQREKLQKQRELLQADREEIYSQIQQLKKLEHLSIMLEHKSLYDDVNNYPARKKSNVLAKAGKNYVNDKEQKICTDGSIKHGMLPNKTMDQTSSPVPASFSWVRKCAQIILGRSPEKVVDESSRKDFVSGYLVHHEEVLNSLEAKEAENGKIANDLYEMRRKINTDGEEDPQFTDGGLYPLPLGRKRLKSSSFDADGNVHLEPCQNYKKESKRHKFVDEGPTGDITVQSVDGSGSMPVDKVSEGSAMFEPCVDEVHESLKDFRGDASGVPSPKETRVSLVERLLEAIETTGKCVENRYLDSLNLKFQDPSEE
ncbi:hypothetical protein Taro_011929, partial [Colocasia esculenta]|nr:hypothetical protein [Colocasia esculenta]